MFATDPQFAALRNPDGSINRDLLAAQGMSREMFAARLRQELAMRQVLHGVGGIGGRRRRRWSTPSLDALLQRREVQIQRFDAQDYRAKVNPSDADIEAYYKANEAQFRAPEQASIEYVVLDLDSADEGHDRHRRGAAPATTTRTPARYTAAEERRASHILIKADKDASAADRAKAKAKAEALLAEVRKAPGGVCRAGHEELRRPGLARRRAATSTSSAAARWSSRSRTRCSR